MSTIADHDLEELTAALASGSSIDPQLKRRIRERSEKVREGVRKKKGLLNIAVDLIRAVRQQ